MLLRPRKFKYKTRQKNRKLRLYKNSKLTFGDSGIKLLQPIRLNNRQIFRYKLFFKKANRRSDTTHRKVWFNLFPFLPISRKVLGSRMGKGKGKLAGWAAELPSGLVLVEFKNLRYGRLLYFTKQFAFKLSSRIKLQLKYNKLVTTAITNNINSRYRSFWT